MLEASTLQYSYAAGQVLDFPEISISEGEHHLIIGPSGCGKTTWLHLLAGLRRSQGGMIKIDGTDIVQLSSSALDAFRGNHIGMVFQTPHFVPSLNVLDNVCLAQTLSGKNKNFDKAKAILERLGLQSKLKQKTTTLSVGEQQRATIARALINDPKIIFADEPTSALDDPNTDAVIRLLLEQAEASNATLIVVTHDNRLKTLFTNSIEL